MRWDLLQLLFVLYYGWDFNFPYNIKLIVVNLLEYITNFVENYDY